jgi:hypothetical protein
LGSSVAGIAQSFQKRSEELDAVIQFVLGGLIQKTLEGKDGFRADWPFETSQESFHRLVRESLQFAISTSSLCCNLERYSVDSVEIEFAVIHFKGFCIRAPVSIPATVVLSSAYLLYSTFIENKREN